MIKNKYLAKILHVLLIDRSRIHERNYLLRLLGIFLIMILLSIREGLRHRAMAAAHEGAAKCLESGKKPDLCEKELQAACKGLAIGKYCGMKHVH